MDNTKDDHSSFNKLTLHERTAVSKFMRAHPELNEPAGRARVFQNYAANELLEIRMEDERRKKEGKEPLSESEKQLILPQPGVVKSVWRNKKEEEISREADMSKVSNLMDGAGLGQGRND